MRQNAVALTPDLVEVAKYRGGEITIDGPAARQSQIRSGAHSNSEVNRVIRIEQALLNQRIYVRVQLGKEIRGYVIERRRLPRKHVGRLEKFRRRALPAGQCIDFAPLQPHRRNRLTGGQQRNFEFVDFRWRRGGENARGSRYGFRIPQISRVLNQYTDFMAVDRQAGKHQL